LLARIIDRGEEIVAVFQEATTYGCVVRAAFGGDQPILPPASKTIDSQVEWWPDDVPGDDFP